MACPQEPTNQDPSPAGKAETTTTTTTGDTQESSEVASAVGSDPNPATMRLPGGRNPRPIPPYQSQFRPVVIHPRGNQSRTHPFIRHLNLSMQL